MKKENKNKQRLNRFVKFCEEHPELRFWQALLEWTKQEYKIDIDFILTAKIGEENISRYKDLLDTFYWE